MELLAVLAVILVAWYLMRSYRAQILAPVLNLENFVFSRTSGALAGSAASSSPIVSSIAKSTQNVLNPVFASIYLNTSNLAQGQALIAPTQPVTGSASIAFPPVRVGGLP